MKTVKRSVVARDWGGGGMYRWSTEYFLGRETTLYDIVVVATCHYSSVKTNRMYNTKSEP